MTADPANVVPTQSDQPIPDLLMTLPVDGAHVVAALRDLDYVVIPPEELQALEPVADAIAAAEAVGLECRDKGYVDDVEAERDRYLSILAQAVAELANPTTGPGDEAMWRDQVLDFVETARAALGGDDA